MALNTWQVMYGETLHFQCQLQHQQCIDCIKCPSTPAKKKKKKHWQNIDTILRKCSVAETIMSNPDILIFRLLFQCSKNCDSSQGRDQRLWAPSVRRPGPVEPPPPNEMIFYTDVSGEPHSESRSAPFPTPGPPFIAPSFWKDWLRPWLSALMARVCLLNQIANCSFVRTYWTKFRNLFQNPCLYSRVYDGLILARLYWHWIWNNIWVDIYVGLM